MKTCESLLKPIDKIYYAFSDDLKGNDKSQTFWNESMVKLNQKTSLSMKVIILNKKSRNPTFCILDSNCHRQYEMSYILNETNTQILRRFHMDYQTVISNSHIVVFFFFFFLWEKKREKKDVSVI